ncbi:MAG: hypothetical protein WAV21_01985 [Minisyncoccia bacterium]
MKTTRDPPVLRWREDSLKDFQSIYQEVYGELLEEEGLEQAARYLINLYTSTYGKPPLIEKHYPYDHI